VIERAFDDGPPGCSDLHAVLGLAIAMAIDASVLGSLGYEVVEAPAPSPTPAPASDSELTALAGPPPADAGADPEGAAARGGGVSRRAVGRDGAGARRRRTAARRARLAAVVRAAGGRARRLGASGGRWHRARWSSGWSPVEWTPASACRSASGCGRGCASVGAAGAYARRSTRGLDEPGQALVEPVGRGAALALELRIVTTPVFAVDVSLDGVVPFFKPSIAVRDPNDASMILDSVNSAPVGAVLAIGGAFTIR
jgi:hypothetical protein